ncbi:MAG TPA: tRNA pseudouridine(55) synthase TruB [Bacteroidales bacterium]|nr:tRNA pseudouridine(55) synthase TruB [Bacteroidales bacterium]
MTAEDFKAGQVILIDKPLTWTSFNVVSKIKYALKRQLQLKDLKVGHAGTLDPLATGLLIVCTGRKTKEIESIQNTEKEYIATIEFGKTTPSYDLETQYNGQFPFEHIDEEAINKAFQSFLGESLQVPPVFSAKMIDGKRAYKYARKGTEVEMRPNIINISELEIISFERPVLVVRIKCSKGTYIRSFAYDLGKALQSGAHLKGLRRTASGNYHVNDAISLDTFQEKLVTLQP